MSRKFWKDVWLMTVGLHPSQRQPIYRGRSQVFPTTPVVPYDRDDLKDDLDEFLAEEMLDPTFAAAYEAAQARHRARVILEHPMACQWFPSVHAYRDEVWRGYT